MQKALLEAEEQVIAQDIIPDEPTGSTDPAGYGDNLSLAHESSS